MSRPRHSIVARLTAWYAGSLFVLAALVTAYLYWTLDSAVMAENRAVLLDRVQTVSSLIARGDADPSALGFAKERVHFEWPSRHFERIYVRVARTDGTVLLETPSLPPEIPSRVFVPPSDVGSGAPDRLRTETVHGPGGITYLTAAAELPTQFAGPVTIQVALDLRRQDEILSRYRAQLAFALLIALALSVLIGRGLAISAFRPVEQIVSTTRRIRATTLHERVGEDELPDELVRLASTVNEMLDRLEDSFDRLSRFSSDIAHELRTPINNIRGEAEVMLSKPRTNEEYRDVVSSCLEEAERVAQVIDSLLFLAKAEQPAMQLRREQVNLREELLKLQDFFEPSAAEERISISLDAPADLVVDVERTLFQRAMGNLVSNAINYNKPGGTIRIDASRQGASAEIRVSDTGRGIAESDLPHVFERFYRTDPARQATKLGGFGLGLTIVRSILHLHRGEIRIESVVGQGTRVIVSIPIGNGTDRQL